MRVLVGTRKGAFIYTSDERRERWELSEPMLHGWAVYDMAADSRATPERLLAAANSDWWGPSVARSDDGGVSWDQRTEGLGFPRDMGISIGNVWHLRPGLESQPGVVYAGLDPVGLFRSEDGGVSWSSVDGLNRHALRPFWRAIPGGDGAGLMEVVLTEGEEAAQRVLDEAGEPDDGLARRREAAQEQLGGMTHSIAIDPRDPSHMYVAVSAGGLYVTADGGESWELIPRLPGEDTADERMLTSQTVAGVASDVDPATEFDMHTMRMDPKDPDRLWSQAHNGVFRSDDRGETWKNLSTELPDFHAFPIAVARGAQDAVYIVPLVNDDFRVAGGQLSVLRTRDDGATWETLTDGLPGPHDYQSVYREGLDTDGLEQEGVYVGASNGQVYASRDGGDHWSRLPGTLPPVLSVTVTVS